MKKGIVFLAVILFMSVICSTYVFAWDDLIYIDRHAKIGDQGNRLAAFGIRYSSAGDVYDKDGEKQELDDSMTGIRVPIWGRCNVIDNVNIFAILPIVSIDNGIDSESGIGDIWLGAKYALMPGGMLTVRGALDIPTGDDEKGLGNAGGFGIDVAAMSEYKMEQIGLFGQLGVRYNGEDSDTKWNPGIGFYLQGRAVYDVNDRLPGWISLTYFNQGDAEVDGTELSDSALNWLELEVGGSYKITDDMWLSVPIEYTLAGTNTDAGFGIGVYFGYYMNR